MLLSGISGDSDDPGDNGKPPVFKTWTGLYVSVLSYLAVLITLFYIFTKAYQVPQ